MKMQPCPVLILLSCAICIVLTAETRGECKNEPVREKTINLCFRTGPTQVGLHSHRIKLAVQMDKTASENQCGKVFVLGPSHEVRMTSEGQAPDGYCGISLFTPRKARNFTCDAICVTFKTASVSTCEVKVKFVGHKFRKEGDLQKAYDCHNKNREPFCWDVSSLRVEVIESHDYAYVWDHKPQYGFDIDVYARCTKDNIPVPAYFSSLDEDLERQTYVEGLVVGLCLACVFLIILFITWCYYRHKATSNAPSAAETPRRGGKSKKPRTNILSTFRAKLPIGRRNRDNDPDEPKEGAVYRKTGSQASTVVATKGTPEDPDTISELSPLTAEANGEKQPEFDEVKLVITSDTDEDLKKLKSEMEKAKDTKQEAETKCDTPDVVVHSGSGEIAAEKEDASKSSEAGENDDIDKEPIGESENAVCFNS